MSFVYKFTAKNDLDRNFGKTYLENYIIDHLEICMLVNYIYLYPLMKKKKWCLSNKVFIDLWNMISILYAQNERGPH
jgi:hypothetical protein